MLQHAHVRTTIRRKKILFRAIVAKYSDLSGRVFKLHSTFDSCRSLGGKSVFQFLIELTLNGEHALRSSLDEIREGIGSSDNPLYSTGCQWPPYSIPLSVPLQHTYLEVVGSNPMTAKNILAQKSFVPRGTSPYLC